MHDVPVYYDPVKKMFYYIKWEETGNSDIPHRIYINL